MKYGVAILAIAIFSIAMAGCTTTVPPMAPIPGSLTYGGRVVHSPYAPGTVIKNTFLGQFGYRTFEKYVVQPDGTLKLTSQRTGPDFLVD